MLSRPADHLFWMSRYMERAGPAHRAGDEVNTSRACQRAAGFSALREYA
jgi:uncharacterized alpha-E superfamily protein